MFPVKVDHLKDPALHKILLQVFMEVCEEEEDQNDIYLFIYLFIRRQQSREFILQML